MTLSINYEVIIVSIVLIFLLISLYKEIVGAGFTFIIAISVLGVARVLTPSEILSGFANEQIAVIIMLLLLGDIYRQSSVLDILFDKIFRSVHSYKGFMSRMMLLVASFSAFLNNTPLVALLMPYVHNWSRRNKISSSKLLMPLSFAAILGGCATLIGTSTNLIVNGLVVDQTIIPGLAPLSIFEFVYVGGPMIAIGLLYILLIGHRYLPAKKDVIQEFAANRRKYLVEVQIKRKSHLIGKTIANAKLESIEGLYLFEIIRKNYSITPVTPDITLHAQDILLFMGETKAIAEIVNSDPALVIPSVGMFSKKKHTEIVEIVISHNSSLITKTINDENFRQKYDATVLAIHRNGEKISGKIGSLELKAGDAILLLAGKNFSDLIQRTQDFYAISKVKEINRLGIMKTTVLIAGTILVILLSALKILSLFMGLIVLLTILLLMKIASPKDLAKSIDYDLALIIALSLALGTAMMKTGVAEMIADFIIKVFIPLGKAGILSGIYIITSILAAYITNKAAVAIIFPISLTTALHLDLNPIPFILVVSFAAAANFMTPIGYQTNLMVYGPGGYTFKDYFKIGFPLTVIYGIVTVVILRYLYL